MRNEIKKVILLGLLRADDTPMPDSSLLGLGLTVFPTPARSAVESVIQELEAAKSIAGADEEITGRVWILTAKGKLQAQQL